jgi:outer membrane murein-binding lipoprotein Lpp
MGAITTGGLRKTAGFVKSCKGLLGALLVAGCSSGQTPEPPPAKTVFDPLTQQVENARAVQKTVDDDADRMRKATAAQEHGDAPP